MTGLLDLSAYKVTNFTSDVDATVQDSMIDAIQAFANAIVNANIDPAAAITLSKLAGYPSDATKVAAGDGSWRTIMPQGVVTGSGGSGTTFTPNASAGNVFIYSLTASGSYTIGAPTSPTTGQKITLILSTGSATTTTFTWNAVYKMAGAYNPINANKWYSIEFVYDGTEWVEICRSGSAS